MPRPVTISLLLLTGVALGLVFFGGLWLTVRALPTVRYPTALVVGSFWGRTAIVVAAFAYLFASGWQNTLIGLIGFLAARVLISRWAPHRSAPRPRME